MIITEAINGNTATAYFRGSERKLKRFFSNEYKNFEHIDFKNYDDALYTVFNLKSTNDPNSHGKRNYGDVIVQVKVKGLTNFFFTSYNLYKKYINPNADKDTWIDEQNKKFGSSISTRNYNFSYDRNRRSKQYDPFYNNDTVSSYHHLISQKFEDENALPRQQLPQRLSSKAQKKMSEANLKEWQAYLTKIPNSGKIKGIVYHGQSDGDCILIYDWKACIPVSYSLDDGKTWLKEFEGRPIKDIVKEQGFKFSGNDNIDNYRKTSGRINEDYFPY